MSIVCASWNDSKVFVGVQGVLGTTSFYRSTPTTQYVRVGIS